MNKLIIIGAGGHSKVLKDIAQLNGYIDIYFLDDNKKDQDIIGTTNDINKYLDYDFFVGIGNNAVRRKLHLLLKENNITPINLIHPSSVIDKTVKLTHGIAVMAQAVINAESIIDEGVIINTSASVDHECHIHSFTHICPGVHIAGNVHIGSEVWVGIGSSIINNITITSQCLFGAGSVIIHDINESGTYVGVPVRRIHS